jgi:hypothetical protein
MLLTFGYVQKTSWRDPLARRQSSLSACRLPIIEHSVVEPGLDATGRDGRDDVAWCDRTGMSSGRWSTFSVTL